MDTYARGVEIVQGLEALGTRATMDPALANPPCILVIPPNLTFDLQCDAVTATWSLVALAASSNTADRSTWLALQTMAQHLAKVTDVHGAELVSYVLNGRTFPGYLFSFTEGID
jgi:hypothetical protein